MIYLLYLVQLFGVVYVVSWFILLTCQQKVSFTDNNHNICSIATVSNSVKIF